MISVTQGPKNNAALAALDYNKTFEAGAEGVRKIAEAKEAKNASIIKAVEDMQTQMKESQITASKVQGAINENPALFEGLEEGNNLTSKSFKSILQGNASQQDFNNLAAYIDSANTQKEIGEKTKLREDNTKVAQGTAEAVSMIFSGLSEDDYDNVSKADVTMAFMKVSEKYEDPAIKNAINNAGLEYSNNIIDTIDKTAGIKDIQKNTRDLDAFREAYLSVNDFEANKIIRSNPDLVKQYTVQDAYGNDIGVRDVEYIAKSLGLTRIKPTGGAGGEANGTTSEVPVNELNIQEAEQEFLVGEEWTGSMLTEDQVMQMSDKAIEAYIFKYNGEFAEPGSTEQVESNAILSSDEIKIATISEPVKPNKPNKQSYIAQYAKGFARGSEPYKLAEAKFEEANAIYKSAMVKYKEQKKIYQENNRSRR